MKKMICFVLPLLVLTLYGEETIHLWSGRLVTLPGNGSWQICAEHGRILASGNGETPEFMSTHPSDANRIKQINATIPEALKYKK